MRVQTVLGDAWRDATAWARANRRLAVALAVAALANIVYAAYRAAFLKSCDLVHGFLEPTRAMLFEGKDPFVEFRFNSYSPFFYAVLAPLAPLPNGAASVVWSLLSIGFLFATFAFFGAMERSAEEAPAAKRGTGYFSERALQWLRRSCGVGKVACPLFAGAALVVDNLNLGQSNLLALCFSAAALWALSQKRDLTAGVMLAVAIAWKVTPALLLGVFLLKGRVKALAGVALGLVLCLAFVPALVFGPSRAATYLHEWPDLVLVPFARGEKGQTTNIDWYHTNQSMEAALQRSLTPYGTEHYAGAHRFVDPALFTEAQVHALAGASRLVLLALLAWATWRSRDDDRQLALVGSLYLLGALFISPASWFSHYVAALPAYLVALDRGKGAAVLVAVAATLVSLGSHMRSYSLVFVAHAVLFAVLWRAAVTRRLPAA